MIYKGEMEFSYQSVIPDPYQVKGKPDPWFERPMVLGKVKGASGSRTI